MKSRRLVPLVAVAVVAAGAFAPAVAAPKGKPISKTYTMRQAPLACQPDGGDLAIHFESFTATGPGTLTAKINGFQGDWDLDIRNADNAVLATGGGSATGPTSVKVNPSEILIYKITKPGKYTVASCNFAGSPDAVGSYEFKPKK